MVWKIGVGLLVIAVLLSAACMIHGIGSGIAIPYQDPTPEQATHERYHRGISQSLFMAAGVAWLTTAMAGAASVVRWLFRRRHGLADQDKATNF
jgi:hypothetical protein